jgi:hypothetical protein
LHEMVWQAQECAPMRAGQIASRARELQSALEPDKVQAHGIVPPMGVHGSMLAGAMILAGCVILVHARLHPYDVLPPWLWWVLR